MKPVNEILIEIAAEIKRCRKRGRILSLHEGVGLILEEYMEFCAEIFKKKPDCQRAREELVQVAALCVKTIESCCME